MENEITIRELKCLPDIESYELWDESTNKWIDAKTSNHAYDGSVGFSSVENPYAPIHSVAIYHRYTRQYVVYAIPPNLAARDPNDDDYHSGFATDEFIDSLNEVTPLPEEDISIVLCKDEAELLTYLLEEIQDSDAISGWNSDFFDVPYICKRIEKILGKKQLKRMSFEFGGMPKYREVEEKGHVNTTADLDGRLSVDYMIIFKKYEMAERPSYKLESIADEMLPELPKLEYEGSLATLYRKNFPWFLRYNFRDTEILEGLERKLGYVGVANSMYHMSTGLYKHVPGTLKLAELATINECHHELGGLVVNDMRVDKSDGSKIQGAFVLIPQVGMHEDTGAIDITSLYPSSIRANNISPETLMGQFVHTKRDAADNLDTTWATKQIANKTDEEITIEFDNTTHVPESLRGVSYTAPANDWNATLRNQRWSVSGYGTVFNQNEPGIMPTILAGWFAKRIEYQKKKYEAEKSDDMNKAAYFDRLQYIYKIKLNSFYGAISQKYFRFYDPRMGESTTGTGRMILIHQCAKVCEFLDGKYTEPDIEVVKSKNVKGVKEKKVHLGYSDKYSVVYGDSVAADTIIETQNGQKTIESLFGDVEYTARGKEFAYCNEKTLTYDPNTRCNVFKPIKHIVRHWVNKKMFRVWIGNTRFVDVTEDHSLMGYNNLGAMVEIKPTEIHETKLIQKDTLITPTKIEEIPYDDYVYDIEVEDTHTFFANNILVHNTDSTYFHVDGKTTKELIEKADETGEYVNASFPEYMARTFLCSNGYNEIVKTGREIVADRGIFVDKKRYILHIIDNEGKTVDKLKVMGLDTKKTTLPKEVSKTINKFIERFLKGENWENISKDIVDYKDYITNTTDVMAIGLPMGVNKVEYYANELKLYGDDEKLPGHVRAAILYNRKKKEYHDTESMEIVSGSKLKVFYVKEIYGKFKAIAIPVDIEEVPKWFLKHYTIDREMHVERLVDNPLDNIIKAIGKVCPSRQSLFVDDALDY